jgi:hypothetical protein
MTAKEFERLIISSMSAQGEVLEIYYSDGSMVEGFVQMVNMNSAGFAYVNLCKRVVPRGESSDHTVNFDRIIKLIVKPYNQEPKVYE